MVASESEDDGEEDGGRLGIKHAADDIDARHKRGDELKGGVPMDDEGHPEEESGFGGAASEGAAGGKDEEHASNRRGSESAIDFRHLADDRRRQIEH